MTPTVRSVVDRAHVLRADASRIISTVESARERRFTLDSSYSTLGKLSVKQDDLFKQALRCVEHELYRAAHVMAWAAFVDFLHDKLAEDGFAAVNSVRTKWKIKATEDLRIQSDFQVIETARDCKLYSKTLMKALHGLLNKRNECAHPEEYYPVLNDTLGYITDIFKRIKMLQARSLAGTP